jgi:SPP1 gp7 family putative phage head morphogenesis protein
MPTLPKHSEVLVNAKANARAYTLVDQIEKDYQAEIRDSIITALNDGLQLSDWETSFSAINSRYGLGAGTSSALETTFRTVQMSAYNGGKVTDMFSADGQARAEYWMFSAVRDDATTDECSALDGQIFNKTDGDAMSFIPPLDYNCRSTIIELDASEVEGETISAANTTDISPAFDNELLTG